MNEKMFNLDEIKNSQKQAEKINELFELLSSYNAFSLLLLKAKYKYEKMNFKTNGYFDPDCYKKRIDDLFSLFKSNECLKGNQINRHEKDLIFLIDSDTLLRINYYDMIYSTIMGLSNINYKFLKINKCIGKVYNESVYCGDPYYCDRHFEDKEAFGLFRNDGCSITPAYSLNEQFESYNNKDIREILKIQSFDDIYDKITEAKNIKTKKLELTIY